jgi:hypothetical protein
MRLPLRLAGAGKTLRILAHRALAHKRNRHGIIVGGALAKAEPISWLTTALILSSNEVATERKGSASQAQVKIVLDSNEGARTKRPDLVAAGSA